MTEAQRDDLRSYFEDFDGEYYRLTISVAKNENGTMLYNIGKIKKENAAQELPRGVTVSGSLADATSAASSNSIRQEGQKSQEVFSACYFLRINIGHPFETKIGMTVLCFRKTVQLCHCEERSYAASAVCCDVENTKTRTQLNRNGTKCVRVVGTPEGTRTPDLLVRSQTLYPAELLAHGVLSSAHI